MDAILPPRLITRRPAAVAAALFATGILAHPHLPHRPALGAVLVGVLLAAALLLFRRAGICSVLTAAALFVAGAAVAQLEDYRFPVDHIGQFSGDGQRLAAMELEIIQPPRTLARSNDAHIPLPPKQVLSARVERMKMLDGWRDASGEIRVQIDQPHPRLQVGQRIRVLGMLERPAPASNPGQFNAAEYYREQRIVASITVAHAANVQVLSPAAPSLLATLRERTRQVLAMGFDGRRALDHALLRALLLGDTDPQLSDVKEDFQRTGTGHHLAISGLHVAVLGMVVFGVCRLFCLPPRISAWIGMGFVLLYGTVALPSPPVVRSVLLCLAFGLGLVQRRALDPIQLLAFSVLLMLIYHPLDLYNAGFQLSFGTVLGLMVFTRPARDFLLSLRDPDVVIAEKAQPPTGAAAAWSVVRTRLIDVLAAGGVAWAVSAPLVALHFEQLNPWAILASIVLAPVVFTALVAGLLKIALTLCWPSAAWLWAELAAAPIAMLRRLADGLAMMPGADVPLPSPPVWMILAWYLVLCLPLLRLPRLRCVVRFAPLTQCAAVVLLPLLGLLPQADEGGVRLTVLAVGAGSCNVVELPGGRTILIDAGSISLPDLRQRCLGPFLRHRGRRSVDALFLSHANHDHYSAAAEVIDAYGVRKSYISPHFRTHAAGNMPAEDLLDLLDRHGPASKFLTLGDRLELADGTRIEVLWPPPDRALSANDSSLVLRLTYAGRSILFTGDVQEEALRQLLRTPETLRCDVLIAPHHGSAEPSTAAFVEAADPQAIISSNDRTLSKKQLDFDSLAGERPLYRTHTSGAVTVRIGPDGLVQIKPFLPRR